LRLELLRRDQGVYRVAYLVLTVEDQRAIYRVAKSYGSDLAHEIELHREGFEAIVTRYPDAARRKELMFDLVAGMLLNWEGLKLNTELGYRAAPLRHANGDQYLLHSEELGANIPEDGMYWGSQCFLGQEISFSTFGDGDSLPRRRGIPDALFDPLEGGLESLKNTPEMVASVKDELIAYVSIALADAGMVMATLREKPLSIAELSHQLNYSGSRLSATINLLLATGYIELNGQAYRVRVPILLERDRPIVKDIITIGRSLLTNWLRNNYERIKRALAGLSPMKNGLPFSLAFNEVWHYIFGWTAKTLAEDGFYINPRSSTYFYRGYVPLVWDTSLYKL
jgi:DNA-binding MarR family transcriptional regulator